MGKRRGGGGWGEGGGIGGGGIMDVGEGWARVREVKLNEEVYRVGVGGKGEWDGGVVGVR